MKRNNYSSFSPVDCMFNAMLGLTQTNPVLSERLVKLYGLEFDCLTVADPAANKRQDSVSQLTVNTLVSEGHENSPFEQSATSNVLRNSINASLAQDGATTSASKAPKQEMVAVP